MSKDAIRTIFDSTRELRSSILTDETLISAIDQSSQILLETIKAKGAIYSCGNGGSACDAMHFTEELVARYKRERPGIKAMHLMDPSTLTCWSNDYDFNSVFSRQVETFAMPQDTLCVFTTSGNSQNALQAIAAAKEKGSKVIGFLGKDGGKAKALCDIAMIVPSEETDRIQEVHITIVHILCELIEVELFE